MATNGSFASQDKYKGAPEQYTATSGHTESSAGSASGNGDLSKDQVGWYFVEQYYTTLGKSPEKLHLFYGKRSQFVSGLEAEVAPVSVGRSAIQERIRELDFQDCKIRVSNVDSQASFENIVIQVIGETSNKSAELRKFCQTFVLAQQPTGYFVLNDIFRYINEEGEDEQDQTTVAQDEPASAAQLVEDVEMPKPQPPAEELESLNTEVVAEKLQAVEAEPVREVPTTNGTAAGEGSKDSHEEEDAPTPEIAEREIDEELAQAGPEKPQDPLPSPVVSKPAPAQPVAPPKPMSWANRAAAAIASAPKPVVPIGVPKNTTPPTQTRAPPSAQASKPAQPAPTPVQNNTEQKESEQSEQGSGWQSVGSDHIKRQNRPQSISGPPEKEGTMGYVRNVTEKVGTDELRSALSGYGDLIYFDINRSKNCAFVEFQNPAGYQAASAANPHVIAGESIFVESRRPKTNAYGGVGYAGPRTGMNNRPRGGFDQGRPGNQGGRGNLQQNRGGRGGGPATRGRGTSQAAA